MRALFRSAFKITQEFGVNKEYYGQFGLKGHEGIDLIPTGTVWDVMALEDGVIVKDENNKLSGAYGNYVTIWHPSIKKATQYCHFEENYVENGQQVKRGDKIGKMGDSGNTTGAHVHLNLFEVDENGYRLNKSNGFNGGIDPLPFLNETAGSVPVDTSLQECLRQHEDLVGQIEKELKPCINELEQMVSDKIHELENTQGQINSLEDFQKDLSIKLGCNNQQSDIMGEVSRLISEEDTYRKAIEKIQKMNELVSSQTVELEIANKLIEDQAKELVTARQALKNSQDQLLESDRKLQELINAEEFKVIFKIFGLYVCRR